MSITLLRIAVPLAIGVIPASLGYFAVLGGHRIEPPTRTEFEHRARLLGKPTDTPARLQTLEWLKRHRTADAATVAIPALERCVREDPEAAIRKAAVETLALIADHHRQPCPLAVVEAMLDEDALVSEAGEDCASLFERFAPGSVDVLLRCVESESAKIRCGSVLHLARAAGKDEKALQAIENATHDESFGVRHNAHVAMFRVTDDLGEYLKYIIRLREDPEGVLSKIDPDLESGRLERVTRELALIGTAEGIAGWGESRADELAPALLKLLDSPSPIMRRGAANLIAEEPQRPKVMIRLGKANVEDRLRELRDDDPDPAVRKAAGLALERIGKGNRRH